MSDRKNKGTILQGVSDEDIINYTIHEEALPGGKHADHLYLDHLGNVTVGYGRMIPNRSKILDMNMYVGGSTPLRYASSSERQEAFDTIKRMPFGKNLPASSYKPRSQNSLKNLYLDQEEAMNLLKGDLGSAAKDAALNFPQLDSYPNHAQRALLDMQFNMGINKFNADKWPKLFKAIDEGDWDGAARESHRKGISESGNNTIHEWFRQSKQ